MTNLLLKINIFDDNDYQDVIESSLERGQKKSLFYLNSQVIYEAEKDLDIKKCILSSDYLIADGYSIVWANKKILNKRIEKVVFTYSYFNFMRELFIKNNTSLFFLGASKENIEKAVKLEMVNFPLLKIAGHHHGYFDKNLESDKIIKSINESNAGVLIVGMGCPVAEIWIIENKDKLNPKIIFSVGGFFDFLARDKVVAPKWTYNSGFEWVFRLVQDPRKLFKRYLIANTYFILYTIKSVLFNHKKISDL